MKIQIFVGFKDSIEAVAIFSALRIYSFSFHELLIVESGSSNAILFWLLALTKGPGSFILFSMSMLLVPRMILRVCWLSGGR